MKRRVSEKGQVTIPKRLRDRLGIRPGDVLEFSEEGGRLVVAKRDGEDPVTAVYGSLGSGRNTDDLMVELRPHYDDP